MGRFVQRRQGGDRVFELIGRGKGPHGAFVEPAGRAQRGDTAACGGIVVRTSAGCVENRGRNLRYGGLDQRGHRRICRRELEPNVVRGPDQQPHQMMDGEYRAASRRGWRARRRPQTASAACSGTAVGNRAPGLPAVLSTTALSPRSTSTSVSASSSELRREMASRCCWLLFRALDLAGYRRRASSDCSSTGPATSISSSDASRRLILDRRAFFG